MVKYEEFILENGLQVIIHEDHSTPLAGVNLLYNVGARDEKETKTGFAHLFEHLMFEGSASAPSFDESLERAGGQNNAFTNNDITNYYEILPAANLETALWLESDRMRALNINKKSLSIQQKVVIEEYKENYINQPYGEAWHLLRNMAYKRHPYKWPTIGKSLSHIEDVQLDDVKDFFHSYYCPNNAILVLAGNIENKKVKKMVDYWFADIKPGKARSRSLPQEPEQKDARRHTFEANVPVDAIYIAFPMAPHLHQRYYIYDLISDILSNGHSSRLYRNLVKEKQIFSGIDAYITGNIDAGLFVIQGKISEGMSLEEGEAAIWQELETLHNHQVSKRELKKVKNKIESSHEFGQVNLMNRAFNLAYSKLLGDIELVNSEIDHYLAVTPEQVKEVAQDSFVPTKSSTLFYKAIKS